MGPTDFTVVVNVAECFADGVFPELVKGRVAPVGVAGDAVAAAPPCPTPELPGITADCIVRITKPQRINY